MKRGQLLSRFSAMYIAICIGCVIPACIGQSLNAKIFDIVITNGDVNVQS